MPNPPHVIDVFVSPIRDNQTAQIVLVALFALMLLDMIFGFSAAAKDGRVKSSVMREGIWHKASEVGVVLIADIFDGMLMGGVNLGYSAPILTSVIILLCINELVSCAENLVKLNPELADWHVFDWIGEANGEMGDAHYDGSEVRNAKHQ